jgi:pimeloyl-ACP methyl ester carboxylesterase
MSDDAAIGTESRSFLTSMVVPLICRLGTIAGGLLVCAVGLLYAKQDSMLYFPSIGGVPRRPSQNPPRYRSPSEHDIPHETNMIRCSDGVRIHSWLLLQPGSREKRSPTVLFFHGNAGNIGLRLPNAMQMYHHLGANVMLVEYRGYGDSDDVSPNEAGLKLDAEAALAFARGHAAVDPGRVFAFGRSLGGGVAFHLAKHAEDSGSPLAGLMVENTFLSIATMVDHLLPLVAPLKFLILTLDWNSATIAPTLRRSPVLYLAGARDELVPPSHMRDLYQASAGTGSIARMHVVPGGTHNDTWLQGGKAYWEAIRNFLGEALDLEKGELAAAGDGGAHAAMEGAASDVIPTMPGNLVGMAREATVAGATAAASSVTEKGRKKEL